MARHALADVRHGLPMRNNHGPLDGIVGTLILKPLHALAELRHELSMRNNGGTVGTFTLKALQLEDAVSLLAAQNQVHPLIEWLENDVPKWDRIKRLAYLMEDTFILKDTGDTPDDRDDEKTASSHSGDRSTSC